MRRLHLLPEGADAAAGVLVQARGIRAIGDGVVSVVLAVYLTALGLTATEWGSW